jgi:hypothetical protein
MVMNILIEDAEKLEYLTSNNKWSKKPADGKNFEITATALAAAKLETMGRFNIVGHFSGNDQLFNLDRGHGKSAA